MVSLSGSAKILGGGMVLAAAVLAGGCNANSGNSSGTAIGKSDSAACGLRTGLDSLLREHVVLALAATDSALGGRNEEFSAAVASLDANSHELSDAIGQVYGPDAGKSFYELWNRHIGFFVDYTKAVAAKDETAQNKSVEDLIGYTNDFGAFIETATGGRLKKDAVAELVKTHVVGLKGAVDAQANKDFAGAYTKERDAEKHMDTIGNVLTDAIVDQFPDRF